MTQACCIALRRTTVLPARRLFLSAPFAAVLRYQ
jgi:hypothetical protein